MPKSRIVSLPTTEDIRTARAKSGLTQAAAAELVYSRRRTWEDWEAGVSRMHPAIFELFVAKTSALERKSEMSKARACEYIPCYLPGVRYTKADGGSVVGMLSLAIFNTKDAATEAAASILERREEDRRRCAQIPGYQISKPLPETEAVAYPATIERRPDVADVLRPDYAWAKSGGRAN